MAKVKAAGAADVVALSKEGRAGDILIDQVRTELKRLLAQQKRTPTTFAKRSGEQVGYIREVLAGSQVPDLYELSDLAVNLGCRVKIEFVPYKEGA